MNDTNTAIRTLTALDALGVKLSIDDFGTGYSSLAYIKTFPVQTLKIDRSFVRDIAENATDQAIAATIITLAHNLGMRVIAEGIETEQQFDQMRALGADDMQGYLISRPLSAADFERFMCAYGSFRLAA
jgi:EAL domain-containing protein (putative c-di-GMP-specific phosphodiesterase class I)